MNRLNAKSNTRLRRSGHWQSLWEEYDWIVVAIRCLQIWPTRVYNDPEGPLFDRESKRFWNGNREVDE